MDNVTLNVATGPWSIVTTGDDALGDLGSSSLDTVNVAFSGTIETDGSGAMGIVAESFGGPVNVYSAGNIATDGDREVEMPPPALHPPDSASRSPIGFARTWA